MTKSRTLRLLALTLAAALAGCRGDAPADDQETGSMDVETLREARERLPAAVVAQLDSGNAGFRAANQAARAGDGERAQALMRDALRNYREAARMEDDAAAAWFGIYMAENALGNTAAAGEALAKARAVAPEASLVVPGEEGGAP